VAAAGDISHFEDGCHRGRVGLWGFRGPLGASRDHRDEASPWGFLGRHVNKPFNPQVPSPTLQEVATNCLARSIPEVVFGRKRAGPPCAELIMCRVPTGATRGLRRES